MLDPELALLNGYLVVGAMLVGLGLIGFLARRNLITMFLAAEMMLLGVSLSLTAWGRYWNDLGGQMLVLLMIAVAACEAAIALAMILMLYRRHGTLDVVLWQQLREEDLPAWEAAAPPEESPEPTPEWPRLPPAGIVPEVPSQPIEHRPHV